jgi:hypothetical protein
MNVLVGEHRALNYFDVAKLTILTPLFAKYLITTIPTRQPSKLEGIHSSRSPENLYSNKHQLISHIQEAHRIMTYDMQAYSTEHTDGN